MPGCCRKTSKDICQVGRYWFGITDSFYGVPAFRAGVKYPDYTTWNIGVGLTYKSLTVDLRYYDTMLSPGECNVLTSDHTATLQLCRDHAG